MREKPDTGKYSRAPDASRTRDKIVPFDPATAPVHTDSEAAGWSTSAAASIAAAQGQQREQVPEAPTADHEVTGRAQHQIPERRQAWLFAACLGFLALLGLTIAYVTTP